MDSISSHQLFGTQMKYPCDLFLAISYFQALLSKSKINTIIFVSVDNTHISFLFFIFYIVILVVHIILSIHFYLHIGIIYISQKLSVAWR